MKFIHVLAISCTLSAAPMLAFGQGSGPPGGAGPQAQPAPAAPAPASGQKQLNPWIDCGIGAFLFTSEKWGWAAAVSNIIWDWGITGTTSAVSSPHTCNSDKAKTARFIGTTYPVLVEETARGEGRHLHAMLEILGCEPAAHGRIISSIRADFGPYLRHPGYVQKSASGKAEGYYDLVLATVAEGYPRQCGAT